MFPNRYFGARYFGDRYFGPASADGGAGGGGNWLILSRRKGRR